jgi:2-oxoglutarate dehydrogenase complex dehydrogenase (E1) component-like enzyme
MSNPTVHSDEQAALIDAHTHACALAQRYGHACDVLLDDGDLKDRLGKRRGELDSLSDELEARIRAQDLMPHDVNVDREDLARLADRFREWLDHERHSHLQRALADRETELIDRLEALQRAGGEAAAIGAAISAGRRMIDALEAG